MTFGLASFWALFHAQAVVIVKGEWMLAKLLVMRLQTSIKILVLLIVMNLILKHII